MLLPLIGAFPFTQWHILVGLPTAKYLRNTNFYILSIPLLMHFGTRFAGAFPLLQWHTRIIVSTTNHILEIDIDIQRNVVELLGLLRRHLEIKLQRSVFHRHNPPPMMCPF